MKASRLHEIMDSDSVALWRIFGTTRYRDIKKKKKTPVLRQGLQDTSLNMIDYLYFKWQGVYVKDFPTQGTSTPCPFLFRVVSLSKETRVEGVFTVLVGVWGGVWINNCRSVKYVARGTWRCGVPVAEHWLELDVGLELHPGLGRNDAVAVLNSSPQLQLFQLLPQVLPLLLLLLLPETWEQKESQRLFKCR